MTQINLAWVDNSGGEASFEIQRSTDGTTFSSIATPAVGVTSYSDTGLTSGPTYTYQIQAVWAGTSSSAATASSQVAPANTWTALTNAAPNPTGTMLLLTNGTVMVQNANGVTNVWYLLTPDSTGNYINGTWTTLSPMITQRLYYTSDMLQNGNVFVLGGEYSGPSGTQNLTNLGEIYDTVANTWSAIATIPAANFGDDPSEVLPNGNILCGGIGSALTYLYNPTANSWAIGPDKLYGDPSDEETWVKLPDDSILSYDVFMNAQEGQRYLPTLNEWVDAGQSPVKLHSTAFELGPAMLLPNGTVFFIGATSNTALYTPPSTLLSTGSWATGPTIPGGMGANDAPAAELPNGHVIFVVGPTPGFATPTEMMEYDPTANTITQVTTPGAMNIGLHLNYTSRLLVLPSGQILYTTGSSTMWIYTPGGSPNPSWRPAITSVVNDGAGTYTLTGTQLNGLSEGSNYGDDVENATNYPVIRLVDTGGTVRYARTMNWSSTSVATGSKPVTVDFTLPAGISPGSGTCHTLTTIANGISSANYSFSP